MNKDQLRKLIREVLKYLEPEIPYSETAVELLMLTAAKESNLGEYIEQIKGPALGIFQMEPTTELCIWDNFLRHKPALKTKIKDLMDSTEATWDLKTNLAYQVAMARVHYFRKPFPLHKQICVDWMAKVWKKHYNTVLGAGTEEQAVKAYNKLCK